MVRSVVSFITNPLLLSMEEEATSNLSLQSFEHSLLYISPVDGTLLRFVVLIDNILIDACNKLKCFLWSDSSFLYSTGSISMGSKRNAKVKNSFCYLQLDLEHRSSPWVPKVPTNYILFHNSSMLLRIWKVSHNIFKRSKKFLKRQTPNL